MKTIYQLSKKQQKFLEEDMTASLYMKFNKESVLDFIIKRGTYNQDEQTILQSLRKIYIDEYPKYKVKTHV